MKISRKKTIENKLKILINKPLTDFWIGGWHIFEFGKQVEFKNKNGKVATHGEISIDVNNCSWRFIKNDRKIVYARYDVVKNERSIRLKTKSYNDLFGLIKNSSLVVLNINSDVFGGLLIELTNDYKLEILPNSSEKEDEFWRLKNLTDLSDNDFVVKCGKIND